MTTVFVSGFTGYIALHIVKQLLENGYTVIGSARTEKKAEQYAKVINNPKFSYVAVAHLDEEHAFDKVFQQHPEIELVFHVASPLVLSPEDPEKEVLIPAIKGTTGIMQSISDYGKNVKRLVITSSYAAHNSPDDHYGKTNRFVHNEDISNLTYERSKTDPSAAYWGSKKFADRASWEFMEQNKPHFELVSISPVWCFGPQAYDELAAKPVSSLQFIMQYINIREGDSVPKSTGGLFTDVRDVAKLHIVAATSDKTAGKRLLIGESKFDITNVIAVAKKYYPELPLLKLEPHTQDEIDVPYVNYSKTLELTGVNLTPFETSVKESLEQMKRMGNF